jgi:hypothetical protein
MLVAAMQCVAMASSDDAMSGRRNFMRSVLARRDGDASGRTSHVAARVKVRADRSGPRAKPLKNQPALLHAQLRWAGASIP